MGHSDQPPAAKGNPFGASLISFYPLKTASLLEIKREPRQLLQPATVSSLRVGPVSSVSLHLVKHFP